MGCNGVVTGGCNGWSWGGNGCSGMVVMGGYGVVTSGYRWFSVASNSFDLLNSMIH